MSQDLIQYVCKELDDLKNEVKQLSEKVNQLDGKVTAMVDNNQTLITLIKYVITPLLIIVGGLVGIKLVLP